MVVDVKTASRKPSGLAADHALQLATYAQLVLGASRETRIDTLVGTKEPQLVQIEHTPGEAGRRLVERLYPLVAEGIAGGCTRRIATPAFAAGGIAISGRNARENLEGLLNEQTGITVLKRWGGLSGS